jgi:hypothetical protein
MLPSTIENCPAILRTNEFLQHCGFRIQDEREHGPVSHVTAVKASSRSNEVSQQQ